MKCVQKIWKSVQMTWFERRARKTPGAKIQMIRKVVECVCVYTHAHLFGWGRKTLLITFLFPWGRSLSYGLEQSLHNSICTFQFTLFLHTKDKKPRERAWVGVVFYFSSKRKIAKGKILFLALSSVEMCSFPLRLTSVVYEELKKEAKTIEKQFKAFPHISWE